MNAFLLGAKYANPQARLQAITINSWHDPFFETQAAQHFLDECDILAQHSDTSEPQQIFVSHDRQCIGSNSDTRVFLGERVLVSPMFHWEVPYIDVVQVQIDEQHLIIDHNFHLCATNSMDLTL